MFYQFNLSCAARFVSRVLVLISIAAIGLASAQKSFGQAPDNSQVSAAAADPTPTPANAKSKADDDAAAKGKKPKRGSLILAPIPIISPAFGAGLIVGVGYVFKMNMEDKVSPASSIGFAGAFTKNGSRGAALGGHLYFAENKYQTRFAFAKGRANYEFFGIGQNPSTDGISVLIKQSGSLLFGEFMRNVGKKIFIGPRYQYRKLTAHLGNTTTQGGFVIPAIDLKSTTAALGFRVLRDTTDSGFYPTKGGIFSLTGDYFDKALGSNRTYQTYHVFYNGYRAIGEKQVIAYRATACTSSQNSPFFDLCLFGGSDLRGYTTGKFQDHRMFATQVEYRRELKYRLGLVGFAGVGGVAPTWGQFRSDKLLPAAGVGLRFMLDKKNHINYRVDLGFGRGGHTLSISVTEAF